MPVEKGVVAKEREGFLEDLVRGGSALGESALAERGADLIGGFSGRDRTAG